MPRPILQESHIHAAVRSRISDHHREVIDEVESAVAANDVVIVGMAMNPFPRKARKALDAAGIPTSTWSTAAISASGVGAMR